MDHNSKLFKVKLKSLRSVSNKGSVRSSEMLQIGDKFRARVGEDVGEKVVEYFRSRCREDVKV